ncbi:hypothetical protein ACCS81_08410 [Rhizobium ruizarguesonis]
MLYEAELLGLRFDHSKAKAMLYAAEEIDVDATIHESLRSWWWIAEAVPKRRREPAGWSVNWGRRRAIPEGSMVHRAALTRKNYKIQLPQVYEVCDRPKGFLDGDTEGT